MAYPEGGVDSAGERVQNVDVLVLVQQDEAQEDLQERWLRDAAQEKVQVGCGGHDLLHGHLWPTGERSQVSAPQGLSKGPVPWDPSEQALKPLTFTFPQATFSKGDAKA